MTRSNPRIYVALPAMDELENLPAFMDCIRNQTYSPVSLFVCVNQPDLWWSKVDKQELCFRNRQSMEYLRSLEGLDLTLVDRSSPGHGWPERKAGVGHARRLLMDSISEVADPDDIIVSLDADTAFGPDYLSSLVDSIRKSPDAKAISVPYYHRLTGDPEKDRAILRYEIYMRHYAVNLWRIGSPYSFTAIGSAMALPIRSYRAVGGITPHNSGEDFYFLLKLRKYGPVLTWNPEKVYPAARYSDRVGFGTGPAMIKGSRGDWRSYPVYSRESFDEVKKTCSLFRDLYEKEVPVPMDAFIREKFGEESIWNPLRENSKSVSQFVRACHLKVDAFRVLQFLKWKSDRSGGPDEVNLFDSLEMNFPDYYDSITFDTEAFDLSTRPIEHLDEIRNLLLNIETGYQESFLLTPGFGS